MGFQICFHLVQPWSHFLRLHLLPYEKVWQPCLYGVVERTPLGAAPTTPKPFAIWPMIFAISLCCVMGLTCCTMKIQKVSRTVKSSLENFVCPFVVYFLFLCLESFVHCRTFWGLFAPFSPYGFIQWNQQNIAPSLNSSKECKATCISGSSLGSRIYSFLFTLLGSHARLLY